MDLHVWITQQVDAVEASALAELKYRRATFEPHDGGPVLTGTVTDVTHGPDGIMFDIAQLGVEPRDEVPAPMQAAAAILRRCEADRRILTRHYADPRCAHDPVYATACEGCGTYGDNYDPKTDNINDCPELRDLGHAHGLTDEILAGLDRPTPPERKPIDPSRYANGGLLTPGTVITTSDVPEALRGPHWKP
ncbi:MAG TPA: hypothetical protein VM093_02350 [Aeromicrobium sp.]|nr:hypothetical protein [Aeromicrobium sp.]